LGVPEIQPKKPSDNFAKVYTTILESSIARDYHLRHFFEDMLKLADWKTGIVDMTPEAIGRRINLPESEVIAFLKRLEEEDGMDKSGVAGGRRIVLLDSHRSWGWQIVNYMAYRTIRTASERREYMRTYMKDYREKKAEPKKVRPKKVASTYRDDEARYLNAERNGSLQEDPGQNGLDSVARMKAARAQQVSVAGQTPDAQPLRVDFPQPSGADRNVVNTLRQCEKIDPATIRVSPAAAPASIPANPEPRGPGGILMANLGAPGAVGR
jgi:DNA-binding Lrp family transcriptional regulator